MARLPDPARVLLRSTDDSLLRSTATRLDTIVSRYNSVMTNIKEFEMPLFERKLAKIDEVGKFEQQLAERMYKFISCEAEVLLFFCSLRDELSPLSLTKQKEKGISVLQGNQFNKYRLTLAN